MTGYRTYQLFLAVKQHFSLSNYDLVKYQCKVNCSPKSFQNRKDKYWFDKLSRHYGNDVFNFLVANLSDNNKLTIRQLHEEECRDRWLEWCNRINRLKYDFESTINFLDITTENIKEYFLGNEDGVPIWKDVVRGAITKEQYYIFDKAMGLSEHHMTKYGQQKILRIRAKSYLTYKSVLNIIVGKKDWFEESVLEFLQRKIKDQKSEVKI